MRGCSNSVVKLVVSVRSSWLNWFTWQTERQLQHVVCYSWQRLLAAHHWPDQRGEKEKIFLLCHLHFPLHIRFNWRSPTLFYGGWHVTLFTALLIISYILLLENAVVRSLDENEDGRSFLPWNTNQEQVINNRPIIGTYMEVWVKSILSWLLARYNILNFNGKNVCLIFFPPQEY